MDGLAEVFAFPVRNRQEDGDHARGEQLQKVCVDAEPDHDLQHDVVNNRAEGDGQQLQCKVPEYFAKDGFADDDRGQADDNGAAAHIDVHEPLVLGQQGTGKGDQTIGKHQADHFVKIRIDALRAGHAGIASGRTQRSAVLGPEEPVQDGDEDNRDNDHDENRILPEGDALDIAERHQKIIIIHIHGLIGLPHDFQIDRIQGQLRQNTGQDRRDSHECVQDAGRKSGEHPGAGRGQHGYPDIVAAHQHHNADRAAGGHRAVHGQVRNVQNAIGNVYADRHNAPDQTLGTGPRQSIDQSVDIHLSNPFSFLCNPGHLYGQLFHQDM